MFESEVIKAWFKQHARQMPWRHNRHPYRVWISEVMLQQTQVKTVLPYFHRWMQRFPTVQSLAEANETEVIKLWEGLGYYSRARCLHSAAKKIVSEYGGELPSDIEKLQQIEGMGPYTSAAIASFAFGKRVAVVDGNVRRLLARFFAIESSIDESATQKLIHAYALALLPENQSWVVAEALIELGAIVCKKKPLCHLCPLAAQCSAKKKGCENRLPLRKQRSKPIHLIRQVAVIYHRSDTGSHFLLRRASKGALMEGLVEFVYLDSETLEFDIEKIVQYLKIPLCYKGALGLEKQSFTRYVVELVPHLLEAAYMKRFAPAAGCHFEWIEEERLHSLAFSSGHRRILRNLA